MNEFSLIFGESAFYGFMIVSSVRILYPLSLSLVCRVPAWEGMGLGSDEVSITLSSAFTSSYCHFPPPVYVCMSSFHTRNSDPVSRRWNGLGRRPAEFRMKVTSLFTIGEGFPRMEGKRVQITLLFGTRVLSTPH